SARGDGRTAERAPSHDHHAARAGLRRGRGARRRRRRPRHAGAAPRADRLAGRPGGDMIAAPRTLRARMVVLFGLLLVAIAGFVAVFLPGRIEDQLRVATERRAVTIARVVAGAVEPAVEFDDPDHARSTLMWLDALGDARFAMIGNGKARCAAW